MNDKLETGDQKPSNNSLTAWLDTDTLSIPQVVIHFAFLILLLVYIEIYLLFLQLVFHFVFHTYSDDREFNEIN